MPQILLNKIKDFSGEDVSNKKFANNLLRTKEFMSWKCEEWQQLSYVVFQLSQPTIIDSIEIGNDCSAFVEVLVCNSDAIKERYQVLLSTSSFMTPSESQSVTNCNRVRVFTKQKLSPNAVNEKWDLIKVVCTQPFNKTISYGLSFIRINSPSNDNDDELEPSSTSLNIGAFKLRANDDEQESDSPKSHFTSGKLFANRSNDSHQTRAQSHLASALGLTHNQNSNFPKPTSDTSSPSVKHKQLTTPKTVNTNRNVSPVSQPSNSALKTTKAGPSPPKRQKKIKTIPFNEIMSKIIFSLSGFVNPKRSQLREKATQMGAKYRADLDKSCTHLICAFSNTPKFNDAVKKNVKIVKEIWIEECFKQKTLIPWRNYMMGNYKGPDTPVQSEEDDDDDDQVVNNSNKVQYIDDEEEEDNFHPNRCNQLSNDNSQIREIIGYGDNNNSNYKSQNSDIEMTDDIYDQETDNE